MHQPQYKDALTGQYALPWTYLHAVKDYTDMAAHLEGNPAARAVVNFTPLLIEQLGESARRTDPLVARLTERGRDFSPAQRRDLLTLIGALVGQVLLRYRRLAERGQCELSVTPYGHPIIPLLLDFQCARDALPTLQLPAHAAYPGGAARATWHIEEAIRVFTRAFGARPAGCWPAEGAVSAATLGLLAAAGFRWAASSDGVLRGSLTLTDANAARDPLAYN